MELTGYATNSAGASQKQFEKTMESLESKLNRLHNAWEQFTTGITNAGIIKGAVDLLTNLLTTVNKITDALDPLNTGWAKTLAAILAFKAGSKLVNSAFKNIGTQIAAGLGKDAATQGAEAYHSNFSKKLKTLFSKDKWTKGLSISPEQLAETKQIAKEKEKEVLAAQAVVEKEQAVLATMEQEAIKLDEIAAKKRAQANNVSAQFGKSSSVAQFANAEAIKAENAAIQANSDLKIQNKTINDAQAVAEAKEAAAVEANTVAKETQQGVENAGLLTKVKYYAMMLFGTKTTRENARASLADAGSKFAQAGATGTATGAQAALNTAMMACPIGWILAGIAAIVAALAIFAYVHETGAEKVERMDKTMQKLNESARETTSAINELSDTWEKLQEQNENLDKLTKGTLEWKKQLVEINQTVLDLIEKFPSLAAHVNMIDGKLEISEAGIEELQERQLKAVETQQFASAATQLQQVIQKARNENLYDERNRNFRVDNYKDSQDRKEKEQKALTYDIDRQQKTQLLISSVLSGVKLSANVEDDEKLKSIISGALEAQDYNERLEEIKAETSEDRQAYADLLGLTETQVNQMMKDGDLTSDQLRTSLAAEKLLEEIRSAADDISNKLVTSDTDEHIRRLVQNKLTSSDIEYFGKMTKEHGSQFTTDFIINELKKLGISDSSELKVYADRLKSGGDEYKGLKEGSFFKETTDLIQILNSFFGDNRVDIANQKKLQEKFTQLSLSGISKDGKKEFIEVIKDILNSFGEDAEAKEVFINKFLDLDISSLSEIEGFFEELNIAGHEVSSQLQQEFKETTKAANDFSLENVQETLSSREAANAVKEKIKSDKDSDKSFTEEQYNKVSTALRNNGLGDLADNFVKDPTSSENSPKYFYSGSLSELGDKLENSIDNATDKAIQKLEEQNKIVSNIERVAKESPDLIKAIEDGSYFKGVNAKAFGENGDATTLITGIANQLIGDIEDGIDGFDESRTVKDFLGELSEQIFPDVDAYKAKLTELLEKYKLKPSDVLLLMQNLIPQDVITDNIASSLGLSNNEITDYLKKLRDSLEASDSEIKELPIDILENAIDDSSIDIQAYKDKLKELLDENLITIEQYNEWLKLAPKEVLPKLQQIINPSQNTNQIQADIDALYGSAYSGKTAIEALKIFPKTEQALKAQNSVIQQIVESHEGWEIRLKEIKKQYNLTGAAATENARKIAAAGYELNEQVDNIRSILSDNKEALENTGTDKYYESISKLVDAFKVIYGDKIDDAWVEENLGTIKQITVGKIEAEAAFKELQATAKAELLEIPLKLEVEGDASNADLSFFSDKIKGFYDDWKKNSEALGEEIAGNSDKIKANIASIQEALTKIDNSDASIQVKADTRAALGELIKVALLQAYIKDDIKAYKQWLELANKNNFSVGGLEITRYKKMEVTFNNGKLETKELGSFGEEYLKKVGDVAIIDQSGSVQVTPNSEGTGNPDYDKDKKTSSDDWENDYDKYYNTIKRIESIERERNRLAKEQEKLTKRRFIDEQALMKNKQEQIKLLKQQAAINAELARDAESYLRGSGNGDVWYDTNTGTIQTNPNAAYYNEEQMKIFNKQLKMMEGHYDQMKNAKDNLADIYEQIEDLTEVVSELTDPTYNFDRIVEVLDNTLKNLEREITRLERTDSGATIQQVRRRYEQSAQTYVDKYNQNTNKKAIQEQQLNSLIHSDYSKYFTVDWATKQLTRTATYASITDPEMQKSVDTIIGQAQELCNGIIELDNDQKDIEDSLYDLKKNLADKALEFQEKVYEAVVHAREQAIENLKNIDTSINNAASELTSSIQKNIQKIRQDRQNQKTEEELQNMEARLSFLQTDTSNANQKNILDLQKQLSDKQESYTDSLIDQKISELQAQNDEAAKQRKRQIEVMEAQLEIDKENGVIWRAVDNAIKTGINMSGHIQKGTELYNILSSLDEVTKMNATQIANWMGDLNNLAAMFGANATANLDVESQMSDKVKNADSVFGENSAYIKSLKDRLEAMNNDGNFNHLMWYDQEEQKMVYKYSHYWASSDEEAKAYNNKVAQYTQLAQELANARAYYKMNKDRYMTAAFDRTYHYASGGLADYTGPAWLDGSKTSPELVLSPQDTENFLILKDVLANLINRGSSNDNSNGDNYFEIHIDVDKISGDYDVDQMVERVQQKIAEQSRYRNVNIINMMR